MRMILYLMVALIPIAIVYSRFLDGSKLKDFFLAVSYLSVMAWATIPFLATPTFSCITNDANT